MHYINAQKLYTLKALYTERQGRGDLVDVGQQGAFLIINPENSMKSMQNDLNKQLAFLLRCIFIARVLKRDQR